MKRILSVLLLMFWMMPVSCAASEEFSVPGLESFWQAAEEYGASEGGDLEEGMENLFLDISRSLRVYMRSSVKTGVEILAVVLVCTLAECIDTKKSTELAVRMAGALGVTVISVSSVDTMIGLGRETVGKMSAFSELLLPVMAALTAACGNAGSAAARQGITVLFIQILMQLFEGILIPLLYAYLAACCAYAAVGNEGLKKMSGLLKGTITAMLTAVLLIFVTYLTVSGAIAGGADAAAVKATKMAISRAIPVVGGILADTAESVLAGAGILKSSVGVGGLVAVIAICIGPFLQISFHYISYKVIAALTAAVAPGRLSGLLDQVGSAFGLILGMTGACALLLLFSTVCAISAVTL